ncbi:MAG: PorT family protein [Saprospiraceae bacterium]|nr:PorT family protein [Saprospiraceae bacterium]MBK7810234.1 PorT family protein [Saprospiraceae bacterium]MBK9629837.1 PorT family protein [Saprospiraceae bacterium]
MRNYCTVLIIFLVGIYQLNAQSKGFWLGLQTGPQSNWIFNQDDFDSGGELDHKSTIGFSVGLEAGYKFASTSSLLLGFIYSSQGQNYSTANNTIADYHTKLTYFKIPLLYQLSTPATKNLQFLFQTGFQLSLLMNAESSRLNTFGFYSPLSVDVKNSYSSTVVDFVLGVGVQYHFSPFSISAIIRPDYSLTDIEKTGLKPSSRPQSQNLSVGIPQLVFRYYFGIK